jgi:hypothetical protein
VKKQLQIAKRNEVCEIDVEEAVAMVCTAHMIDA